MLSDRPYLRNDYQREKISFLIWLLSAMIAGFIVQLVLSVWLNATEFERLVTLSPAGFSSGRLWTLFTYAFRHGSILHLLAVALPIFFIGRELAPPSGALSVASQLFPIPVVAWFGATGPTRITLEFGK